MYCTINDLLTRIDEKILINLSNDSGVTATGVNSSVINENIEIAEDLINSSLRNKYSLPLPLVPKIVLQITADIVIYRLYSRRPQEVPKNYSQNYEYAISILKDLQSGTKILELPSVSSTEKETTISAQLYVSDKRAEDRRFSDSLLRGFRL